MSDNTTVLVKPPVEIKQPEAPKPPEAIKEENQKTVSDFVGRMFDGQQKKKAEGVDKPAATEPELDGEGKPIEKKPDAAAPAAKPKKAAKKVEAKAEPVATAPDYEKIAEAAARGVATAIAPKPAEKKESEKPNYDFLSEDEREELPVLEQMEKSNPGKYKGIVSKFTAAIKARQEYEAKWESENPGKEFDPESEEHNDFFAKNDVDWKDRDYNTAIADIATSKVRSELEKKTDGQIEKLTARDRARELEPLVQSEAKQNARTLFTALGDEFKEVLSENGTINGAVVKKLLDSDSVKANMVFNVAQSLENLTAENVRLISNIVPFDPNNPTHKYLNEYLITQEAAMMELEPDQRKNDGKMFMPMIEYYKLTKKEQAKHWTFSAKDLNTLLTADNIRTLKDNIAADEKMFQARATNRGFKKEAKMEGEEHVETVTDKGGEEVDKPLSPSSVEVPILSSQRNGKREPLKNGVGGFLARGFG